MATSETLCPAQSQIVELNLNTHMFSSHHAICIYFNHSHNMSKCICIIISSQFNIPFSFFIISISPSESQFTFLTTIHIYYTIPNGLYLTSANIHIVSQYILNQSIHILTNNTYFHHDFSQHHFHYTFIYIYIYHAQQLPIK